uniref:Uncharacterized protein n=1 Tax=Zea mays TaxID=4577 RepID=B6TF13_MAIZE|nr:hypothetical protein [Zea mays]
MVQRPAAAGDRAGAGWSRVADQPAAAGGTSGGRRRDRRHHHHQQQELVLRRLLPINKAKACRFKRSCFSEEDDAASSAMLLLACVVCAPSPLMVIKILLFTLAACL